MSDAEKIARNDHYKNECQQQEEVIKRLMKSESDYKKKVNDAREYVQFLVIILNNGTQVHFKNTQWGKEILYLLGVEND